MAVPYDQYPRITDDVEVSFDTTDADGVATDPYLVERVTIYFLERGYDTPLADDFENLDVAPFQQAVPVYTLGTAGEPAWLSTGDEDDQSVEHVTSDSEGDPLTGRFRFIWTPVASREGDYVVAWTWRTIAGADTQADSKSFALVSDPAQTSSIPTHITPAEKWPTVLNRWLPEAFKMKMGDSDLTADVVNKLLNATGGLFKVLEDLANQLVDLQDANAISEALLPYLANTFSLKLRSRETTLWRRQVRQAIPLFKQKGTRLGLEGALAAAGAELTSFDTLWQVVSRSTWQEVFTATEAQTEFPLAKVPVDYDPADALNYAVWVRPVGEDQYADADLGDVTFTVEDGVGTLTWGGDELAEGDLLKVLYKFDEVVSQSAEDYLRTLPLADDRDERDVEYPPKNLNVRLVSDSDPYFDVLCPTRNPFRSPLIYGQLRTEFPYSEKIYNMEEYNGSVRDSTDPCDIDKSFLDDCTCCVGSKYDAEVDVRDLTDERISEVREIIREYTPFHATPHKITFLGGIEELMPPAEEEIEVLARIVIEDYVTQGDTEFNRVISAGVENLARNMLSEASEVATRTDGVGFNTAQVLYAPVVPFDGMYVADSVLEILDGPNAGSYAVENPVRHNLDVTDAVPFPNDDSTFPFRISRQWWTGNASVVQDDIALFTEDGTNLLAFGTDAPVTPETPWTVKVLSGPQAGTYPVASVRPTGELVLSDWPTPTTAIDLSFELYNPAGSAVYSGEAGEVSVVRRGKAYCTTDLYSAGVRPGFWYEVGGTQYRIGSLDGGYAYLLDYTAGSQAGAVTIWRRDVDSVGSLGLRGERLETTDDHYTDLEVADYGKDSFLVLIGTSYYQIASWSDTVNGSARYEIELAGTPLPAWGLSGTTNVSYSLIRFDPTQPLYVQEV